MIYTFMWLTIFGGAAIKIERLAAAEGLCCPKFDSDVLAWNSDQVSYRLILVRLNGSFAYFMREHSSYYNDYSI